MLPLPKTIMMRYVTVYDRENKRMGFAESSGSCGDPPDCSSYTQCVECAAEEECAFNFRSKTCFPASKAGFNPLSFPVCRGSSCRCGFGQSFLVYGVATGFASCLAVVGLLVAMITGCAAMRGEGTRPQYEIGDGGEGDSRAAEPMPLIENGKQ